jgi:hypothetical protein
MTSLAPFRLPPAAGLAAPWLDWLGAALRDEPAPLTPPPADALAAVPMLVAHGLGPLLYLRLRDYAAPGWPEPARAALTTAFQANAVRSSLMDLELARIVRALAAAGAPVALLKGAALGRTAYGSPAERPVDDFDLLIPAAAVDAARAALAGLGYWPAGLLGRGRLGRWQRRYRCELPMLGNLPGGQAVLVELHWSLVELPYYIERIPMAQVWAATTPFPGLPGAALPDPATLLLHACAHIGFHHSRALRLIWLVDLDRLARVPGLDWPAMLDRAAQWGLGLTVHAGLRAAAAWLGTPLPPEVLPALAQHAADPVSQAMWGLGDEAPGRAGRRIAATWAAFSPRQRLPYAAWLALRGLTRPWERLHSRARQEA